jgi:putative ABC transport system permease protein
MSLNQIKSELLLRLLLKAAWVRKDRAITALVSVAVVATIATAALTIYGDLEGKLSHAFRGFGANVIIKPQDGSFTQDQSDRVQDQIHGQIKDKTRTKSVPLAYVIATAPGNTRVVVGGTDLDGFQQMNSSWSFQKPNAANGTALLGAKAAERLAPGGNSFELSVGGRRIQVSPLAVFTSGSEDDSRIYLDLQDFRKLSSMAPQTWLLQIDGSSRDIQAMVARLRTAMPDADVQPVRQITQAQTAVVDKTRSVVLASSAVVVVLIMLCMAATFTSSVLERRRDFAVMKALGASNRTVNFLFAAESALLALAGSTAGYVLGSGIAFWIGKANFSAAILPQPVLLLPVLLGSVALALIASTAPLRLLQQIQPAGILRGE